MSLDIDFVDDDDMLIRCDSCGEMTYFSRILDEETKHIETYLCEANAKTIYKIICLLELKAYELRKTYNKWKANDFKKEILL